MVSRHCRASTHSVHCVTKRRREINVETATQSERAQNTLHCIHQQQSVLFLSTSQQTCTRSTTPPCCPTIVFIFVANTARRDRTTQPHFVQEWLLSLPRSQRDARRRSACNIEDDALQIIAEIQTTREAQIWIIAIKQCVV